MKKRITALALTIVMVLGTVSMAAGMEKTITVTPMALTINGQEVTPTKSNGDLAEVFAYDGATYVPLRYLSKLLGIQVEWDKNDPGTAKLTGENLNAPPANVSFNPGTYTGEAQGFGGALKVAVTFSTNRIEKVEVTENKETNGIGSVAVEKLPAQIVEVQSTQIDGISSATFSSNAIKEAVNQAIQAAGIDPATLKPAQGGKTGGEETITADVVVVGAGISGLTASIEAAEAGAKVVLLEKQAMAGGSLALAGGYFATICSDIEKEYGITDTVEAGVERWMNWGRIWGIQTPPDHDSTAWPTAERVNFIAPRMSENINWLTNHGLTPGNILPYTNNLTRIPMESSGAGVAKKLTEAAENAGVTIYTDTPAASLIMDDGKVIGVNAQGKNGTQYTVNGVVILACGGFSANSEMIRKEVPEYINGYSVSSSGNTGDGIKMAAAVGAEMYQDQWVIPYTPGLSASMLADETAKGLAGTQANHLMVNTNGARMINEGSWYAAYSNAMALFSDGTGYVIFDSADADMVAKLEAGVKLGEVVKANSIENLANAFGADASTLKSNVDKYNKVVETGKDTEFPLASSAAAGGAAANTSAYTAVKTGPFYAVHFYSTYMGTIGGVKTNLDSQVIKTDGSIIPGLYAAGEMSNREHYDHTYLGAVSLASYSITGRVAGANAAAEAAGK